MSSERLMVPRGPRKIYLERYFTREGSAFSVKRMPLVSASWTRRRRRALFSGGLLLLCGGAKKSRALRRISVKSIQSSREMSYRATYVVCQHARAHYAQLIASLICNMPPPAGACRGVSGHACHIAIPTCPIPTPFSARPSSHRTTLSAARVQRSSQVVLCLRPPVSSSPLNQKNPPLPPPLPSPPPSHPPRPCRTPESSCRRATSRRKSRSSSRRAPSALG